MRRRQAVPHCFRCGVPKKPRDVRCRDCGSVAFIHGEPRPWPFQFNGDEVKFLFPRMPGRVARVNVDGVGA